MRKAKAGGVLVAMTAAILGLTQMANGQGCKLTRVVLVNNTDLVLDYEVLYTTNGAKGTLQPGKTVDLGTYDPKKTSVVYARVKSRKSNRWGQPIYNVKLGWGIRSGQCTRGSQFYYGHVFPGGWGYYIREISK